jgi:hypothetical protein
MKYSCIGCKYETEDKSNYNKHIGSKKHIKKSVIVVENDCTIEPNIANLATSATLKKKFSTKKKKKVMREYKCDNCDSIFTFSSSLYKHKKNRCKGNIQKDLEKDYMIKQLEFENTYLKKLMEDDKFSGNKINNNILNVSIKNYIQQTYPNAPHLIKLGDYTAIEKENEDDEVTFGEVLVNRYDNNALDKFLGDFIISKYKKEDPAEQAIWSTDASRFTYIINDLLINNKTCWNHDFKGLKTKSYIIEPFLGYIGEYCANYIEQIDVVGEYKKNPTNAIKNDRIITALKNIINEIYHGILSDEIVKYMAPHLHFDKLTDLLL